MSELEGSKYGEQWPLTLTVFQGTVNFTQGYTTVHNQKMGSNGQNFHSIFRRKCVFGGDSVCRTVVLQFSPPNLIPSVCVPGRHCPCSHAMEVVGVKPLDEGGLGLVRLPKYPFKKAGTRSLFINAKHLARSNHLSFLLHVTVPLSRHSHHGQPNNCHRQNLKINTKSLADKSLPFIFVTFLQWFQARDGVGLPND